MKKNTRAFKASAQPIRAAFGTVPPMPKMPYQYAFAKHNMEREIPMVGDVVYAWRQVKRVSRATLAYTATTIAKSAGIPVKLTSQDIYNYESRKCQPKIDKLTIMAYAMGMTPEQLTGYNPNAIQALLSVPHYRAA